MDGPKGLQLSTDLPEHGWLSSWWGLSPTLCVSNICNRTRL